MRLGGGGGRLLPQLSDGNHRGPGFLVCLGREATMYEGDPNADGAVHVVSPCALKN